jgi:hypothetical protein
MQKLFVLLAALSLVGCVHKSVGMLDERTAVISARGSAFSSPAKVQRETWLVAAKITKKHGYRFFQILNGADNSTTATLVVPGQTYSNGSCMGTASTMGNTTFGNANCSGTSYSTPGSIVPIFKPGMSITIRMYREDEVADTKNVWDADSVLAANR